LWDGSFASAGEIVDWIGIWGGSAVHTDFTTANPRISIKTLEGIISASPGDYVIKGVQDEFYPCKPDIFEATYDAVESDPRDKEERPWWAEENERLLTPEEMETYLINSSVKLGDPSDG
jgi:hypothetical protein